MNFKPAFRLFFFLMLVLAYGTTSAVSQENMPTRQPDRIIINLTQDAATSMAVTWRTDATITESICELQIITGGKINPENTKSFKVKTTAVKY